MLEHYSNQKECLYKTEKYQAALKEKALKVKALKAKALLRDEKCVISGENYPKFLECAHILPVYSCNLKEACDINNVLTLDMRLHRCFDDFDLSINPITCLVEVKQNIENEYLHSFHGKKISNLSDIAIKNYLPWHYETFLMNYDK